jgi:hypothetical protein
MFRQGKETLDKFREIIPFVERGDDNQYAF